MFNFLVYLIFEAIYFSFSFLLLKSDPLIYLMVPYYPGASLGAVQADTPLTLEVSVTT